MKQEIAKNLKTLAKSSINNKILFERRKNSFFFPIIIFLLSLFMMTIPPYLSSTNIKGNEVLKNFPGIEKPLETLLTSSLDCVIEDKKLVCANDAAQINSVIGEDIKYTVIANQKSLTTNTEVVYETPKDTDNLIILLDHYIKIRYSQRDHVNKKVEKYEIIGDYSEFEGFNFKEISETLIANPSSVENEVESFLHKTYLSTLDTQVLVNLSSSALSFSFFVLMTCLILKWPTLLKRKKGFKFGECLKISLTSALPALLIATLLYFSTNINFTLSFSAIYIIRIIYIYIKYVLFKTNNIFDQLYSETNEERFKL